MVAAGIAGVVIAPYVAGAALGALGFQAAGVALGSLAAAYQSTVGSVAAGTAFAGTLRVFGLSLAYYRNSSSI